MEKLKRKTKKLNKLMVEKQKQKNHRRTTKKLIGYRL